MRSPKVTLRAAAEKDRRFVWLLRNAPDVRAVSGDPRPIPWTMHQKWWDGRDRNAVDIIVADGKRCGYLRTRVDETGSEVTVSIAISERCRGRGIGSAALRRMAESYERSRWTTRTPPRLVALVAAGNDASRAVFHKAGFVEKWITMERRG